MIIGITVRYKDIENNQKPFNENYIIQQQFIDIANTYGVTLFPICTSIGLEEIVNICDGLIVTGSEIDIDPSYYGEKPFEIPNKVDEYSLDKQIIKSFNDKKKPMIRICGGMQSLNVFFGGTLKRNIKGHYNTKHKINIEKYIDNDFDNPTFYKKLSESFNVQYDDCITNIDVNSYHNQIVDKLGNGLYAVAHSTIDGYVESISTKDGAIIGVQFHPEVNINDDSNKECLFSKMIFSYFFYICERHSDDINLITKS